MNIEKSTLKKLFSNMCCNVCKHDFDENAINIKRIENDLLVLQIICPECGKSFGIAFLGADCINLKDDDSPLEFQQCPQPINFDDVLDAHNFIDNLEKDWNKFIPDRFKQK